MTRRGSFAHSAPPGVPWERLPRHLQRTAERAREFGAVFGSGDWAHLAGLWHDLGKYSLEFQRYLASAADGDVHQAEVRGKVDHSTAGAQHAVSALGPEFGLVLAYVISGHHAGLADWEDAGGLSGLVDRLEKTIPEWRAQAPTSLLARPKPGNPTLRKPDSDPGHAGFRAAFWIRMLFSALCDADFLVTEEFMRPDASAERTARAVGMVDLARSLEEYVSEKSRGAQPTTVNAVRQRVFEACRAAAAGEPGFFTLDVPTGGGKTLASMAFALNHAVAHDLRRVVVAVPYTAIIDQNAEEYRSAFRRCGEDVVLEHHSALEPERESVRSRLQTENWDAQVILTTTVQLFESLFAARPGRCRKLHRLARSVIVLDEAQALPVSLLKPTVWALRELVEVYNCTVVLCSATQPALSWRPSFPIGLRECRPIVPEDASLHRALKRVEASRLGPLGDDALADRMRRETHVLTIVNTTGHAARLAERLGREEGHYHLSARMCPAHRLEVLGLIRTRLEAGSPCRLVSTQVVEAGVDLDFGVVFRDRCGLDSVVQAAGRCNREGRRGTGRVYLFSGDEAPPPGHLRQTADIAEEILPLVADPLSPEAVEQYFRRYYYLRSHAWDGKGVLEALPERPVRGIQFREMETRYRLIDDDVQSLLIPWGERGAELLAKLRAQAFADRGLLRLAQRYSVAVRPALLERLHAIGACEEANGYAFLTEPGFYDAYLGLRIEALTGRARYEDNIL